jgi:hypothetical protein
LVGRWGFCDLIGFARKNLLLINVEAAPESRDRLESILTNLPTRSWEFMIGAMKVNCDDGLSDDKLLSPFAP